MRNQTSTLVMLLLGLGLALLAGDSRAQTQDDANCLANILSKAVGRQGRAMVPMVMRKIEEFKSRDGPKMLVEKLDHMMRMCMCSEESPDGTEAQLCQCAEEVKDCDMMHRPNITTPPEEIKDKINTWMDCLGEARLVNAVTCRDTLFTNPAEMVCEEHEMKCTET